MTTPQTSRAPRPPWIVYILRCSDGTLYTGITTNLERRLAEHNAEAGGSRYTRVRRPVAVVYAEPADSRQEATRRERSIKSLTRGDKLRLVASFAKADKSSPQDDSEPDESHPMSSD